MTVLLRDSRTDERWNAKKDRSETDRHGKIEKDIRYVKIMKLRRQLYKLTTLYRLYSSMQLDAEIVSQAASSWKTTTLYPLLLSAVGRISRF